MTGLSSQQLKSSNFVPACRKNTAEIGEIARYRAISPFPIVFSTRLENFMLFSSNLKLLSANSEFGRVQNLSFGKGFSYML